MFHIDQGMLINSMIQNMLLFGKAFASAMPWYGWIILGVAVMLKIKTA